MTDVARPVLNAISLCAGVGMLDEGVRAALEYLGIELRTVAYGEWEAPAASQLVALMEAGALDAAPVWCGDFRRLDVQRFRGLVDLIVAGFPCQDLSVAGRRAGLDGKRSGLFFDILDVADDSDAWGLVLENVSGIASATASVVDAEEGELDERAAARVLGELADRGWDAEWLTLSASDVGASHGRERWFCFAWRIVDDTSSGRRPWAEHRLGGSIGTTRGERPAQADDAEGPEHKMDDAARAGDHRRERQAEFWRRPSGASEPVAIATRDGWHEGRTESGGEQGRSDASERGRAVDGNAGVHRNVADTDCSGSTEIGRDAAQERRVPQAQCEPEHGAAVSGRSGGALADPGEPRLPLTEQRDLGSARGGV
jgi:DNA (cytosine-5)-methyltransferase 1